MNKTNIIHDGVSIKIFGTDEEDKVIISFTDEITAYYKIKKAVIKDKGFYCNNISCMIFRHLIEGGIPVHFIRQISGREQLCRKVDVIPMEVIVRNVIAGSMAQRLGIEEGMVPEETIFDICYKSDELGDPIINDYHAIALGLATREELNEIYGLTKKVNDILKPLFKSIGITLVDFKIEFGRLPDGSLVVADDITPDSARFWDIETGMKLDKDRFRHDSGQVGQAYRTVYERLASVTKDCIGDE
ncbi:MAG: phosphoribosylaminoimidazolesuccinocarboxamide synthase [Candidatus Cryptobacteroides sp.]